MTAINSNRAIRGPVTDTPPGPVVPSMVLYNGAMTVGPSGCYIAGRR